MAIGITATPTVLNEEQGTFVTLTLTSTDPVPAAGVDVTVDSGVENALGQFDVFATEFTNVRLLGVTDDTSGFIVRLTGQTGTLRLPVYNDTDADSPQTLSFAVQPGTGYTVDPSASSAAISIEDAESTPIPTPTPTPTPEATPTPTPIPEATTPLPEATATTTPTTEVAPTTTATTTPTTEAATTQTPTTTPTTEAATTQTPTTTPTTEAAATQTPTTTPTTEAAATQTSTQSSETTVSLQTIGGTYDASDNLVAPAIVQSVEDAIPVVTFAFSVAGEVPEEGLNVTVNSDTVFRDNFANLGAENFAVGGEFDGAVFNDQGEATGFNFKLTQANALINLGVKDDGGSNDPFDATFTLGAGNGYDVNADVNSSTLTFYNTLDQVPAPTVTPNVSLSVDNKSLDESTGNTSTLTFNLSEPPPEEGVLVYVKSPTETGGEGNATGRSLAEFDVYNAQINGGVFPAPNFAANGFFFKITEQTATIELPAFADGEVEGIEELTFELQQVPGYTIADNAGAVDLTIADNANSQPQVSLTTEPAVLIESEKTVSVHNFSLSAAPPAEGVTVSVSAPKLGDFDLSGIQVEGGEIVSVNEAQDGFDFKLTAKDATIKLPVASDDQPEGLDKATFTLLAGDSYQVNPTAESVTFRTVDIPEQAPAIAEVTEPNDTIATAFDTKLSGFNPVLVASTNIDFDSDNERVDATEDVNFYKFTLEAGDTVAIDTDANQVGGVTPFSTTGLNTVLRLFDADGEQLAVNNNGSAPDEVFFRTTDSYIDYTASTAGTYYAAVSSSPNNAYNPNVAGSGTGNTRGRYDIELALNPDAPSETFIPPAGTPSESAPTVSVQATTGVFNSTEGAEFDTVVVPNLVQSLETQDGQSLLTLSFNTSGEIPADGLEVIVDSDSNLADYLNTNARVILVGANTNGPVYDSNGDLTGFKLKIFEQNASASFPLQNLETPETDGPEPINFTLLPSSNYAVGTDADTASVTAYDTIAQASATVAEPGAQVDISLSESTLVESAGTESTLTFNVNGDIPTDGLLVYVDSPTARALGEIDLTNATISGGAFPPANFDASGFYFNVFEDGASITFAPFNEALDPASTPEQATEGLEEFTFNLVDGPGYTVSPDASSISYTIADDPNSQVIATPPVTTPVAASSVAETNDTIATATSTNIGAGSSSFEISAAIAASSANPRVDASEDVDLYSFNLEAGQEVAIDVDAAELDSKLLYSELRIFDAAGTELAATNFDDFQAAPEEVFSVFGDPYLEFAATDGGTYYLGISQLGNNFYDPFTAGSGSGSIYPDFGIETGEYTVAVKLV